MKIALIQALKVNPINPEIMPPLGLMYLASVLRQKGHEVKILDMRLAKGGLKHNLSDFTPDIVGVGGLSQYGPYIHEVVREAKAGYPQAWIIVGGPHVMSYPEDVALDPDVDIGVLGEGEQSLAEIAATIEAGGDPYSVQGIVFSKDGEISFTGPRPYIENLDEIPFPSWDLIDMEKYFDPRFTHLRRERRFMPIFTSRGCPYNCVFCHNQFGKKFRARSPENVLEEISLLGSRFGISDILPMDDIFNFDLERARRILELIIESGLKIHIGFHNGIRGDRFDEDFMKKLARAGTYHIAIAVESASPRIQKMIRKGLNLEAIGRCIRTANEQGIFTRGFFMLGFPGETREEIKQTVDWAVSSELDIASFFMVCPHPETELWNVARETGKPVRPENIRYDYNIVVESMADVTRDELISLKREAYRRFYFRPGRILNILKRIPNKKLIPVYLWQLYQRMNYERLHQKEALQPS